MPFIDKLDHSSLEQAVHKVFLDAVKAGNILDFTGHEPPCVVGVRVDNTDEDFIVDVLFNQGRGIYAPYSYYTSEHVHDSDRFNKEFYSWHAGCSLDSPFCEPGEFTESEQKQHLEEDILSDSYSHYVMTPHGKLDDLVDHLNSVLEELKHNDNV